MGSHEDTAGILEVELGQVEQGSAASPRPSGPPPTRGCR